MSPKTDQKEQRRITRVELKFPVRVAGKDTPTTNWYEITRLIDVSAFGASFKIPRPVKRGRLVRLSMPMPQQMRTYDFLETQYQIWGIVRRCVLANQNVDSPKYLIGVAFIGKDPPKGYLENPAQLFEILLDQGGEMRNVFVAPENPDESDLAQKDRRHSRYAVPVNIVVELVDQDRNVFESESTVTENISLGGASVFSSMDLEVGSFLQVTSEQYDVSIRAIVRGKRVGPDGIPRLHIEFIDQLFPLTGIESQ